VTDPKLVTTSVKMPVRARWQLRPAGTTTTVDFRSIEHALGVPGDFLVLVVTALVILIVRDLPSGSHARAIR